MCRIELIVLVLPGLIRFSTRVEREFCAPPQLLMRAPLQKIYTIKK